MVRSRRLTLPYLALLALAVACSDDVTGTRSGANQEPLFPATDLNNDLVIDVSTPLTPSAVQGDEFSLDFSSVDLVVNKQFNDFEFGHPRVLYRDMHVEAFNIRTRKWVALADHESCNCTTDFRRTFLDLGLAAEDFVNATHRMRLRAAAGTAGREYSIRALRVDDNYAPWSLANAGSQYGGFDFDGGSAWLADSRVHQVSAQGEPVQVINASVGWSCAVAKGPDNVWATGTIGNGSGIYELDEEGTVLRGFVLGDYFSCDMTFGTDDMWLLGTSQPNTGNQTLSQVDVEASCKTGTVQFLKQFVVPAAALSVASDGTHLYLGIKENRVRVDKLTFEGSVIASHTMDVQWVGGLAWTGIFCGPCIPAQGAFDPGTWYQPFVGPSS